MFINLQLRRMNTIYQEIDSYFLREVLENEPIIGVYLPVQSGGHLNLGMNMDEL